MPLVVLGVVIVLAGFAFGLLIAIVHVIWLSLPVAAFTIAGVAAASQMPRLFTPRWVALRESLTPTGSLDALHWRIGPVARPTSYWKVAGYVVGSFALFKGISVVDSLGWTGDVRFHFFSSESTVDSGLTLAGIGLIGVSAGVVAIGRLRWRLTTDEFIDNAERRFGLGPRALTLKPEQSSRLIGLERLLKENGSLRDEGAVLSPLVGLLTRHGRSTDGPAALRDPATLDGIVRQVEEWACREADAARRLDALSLRLAAHAPTALTRLTMVLTEDGRGFRYEDIADEVEDVVAIADATRSLSVIDAAVDELRERLRAARTDTSTRVTQ